MFKCLPVLLLGHSANHGVLLWCATMVCYFCAILYVSQNYSIIIFAHRNGIKFLAHLAEYGIDVRAKFDQRSVLFTNKLSCDRNATVVETTRAFHTYPGMLLPSNEDSFDLAFVYNALYNSIPSWSFVIASVSICFDAIDMTIHFITFSEWHSANMSRLAAILTLLPSVCISHG